MQILRDVVGALGLGTACAAPFLTPSLHRGGCRQVKGHWCCCVASVSQMGWDAGLETADSGHQHTTGLFQQLTGRGRAEATPAGVARKQMVAHCLSMETGPPDRGMPLVGMKERRPRGRNWERGF